jgi:hypothetical protein
MSPPCFSGQTAARTLCGAWAVLLGLVSVPVAAGADQAAASPAGRAQVRYGGCESQGWCRFWIESPHASPQSVYRVRPDGVPYTPGDEVLSRTVRDRLNALLASMIHQHKRIELLDVRALDDGTHAATVIVNGADVSSDPILRELLEIKAAGTPR